MWCRNAQSGIQWGAIQLCMIYRHLRNRNRMALRDRLSQVT